MAKDNEEIYSIVGTVSDVDESARTCTVTPIDESAEILGVRLQATPDNSTGFVHIPANDSFVVVTFLNKMTGFVALFTEIEKTLYDGDLFEFNGGNNGGITKADATTDKLNAIENKVNTLLSILKGITIPLAPSGSVPFAPFFSTVTDLTNTQANDLKDDKIKH